MCATRAYVNRQVKQVAIHVRRDRELSYLMLVLGVVGCTTRNSYVGYRTAVSMYIVDGNTDNVESSPIIVRLKEKNVYY